MTDAYVNVMIEPGVVTDAVAEIQRLESVAAVHTVTGEYDAIAQLELETKEDIPAAVAEDVHAVGGVIDTFTNVAFEP